MKILFQNRPDAFALWGGDTTQMVQTKKYLETLGVSVDVCLDIEPNVSAYDLVHIFNIQTAEVGIRQVKNAKRQGRLVALSPIFWDMRHLERDEDVVKFHNSHIVRSLAQHNWGLTYQLLKLRRRLDIKSKRLERKLFHQMYEMLSDADLLLPNSYAESEILSVLFDAPFVRAKTAVVFNGIDASASMPDVSQDNSLNPDFPMKYVLQVGRIEPIKGQLKVIKALMKYPEIPLVFVGRSNNLPYWEQCKSLGNKRGNTWFVEEVLHETLPHYYRRAQVHVLPSLRESPGLVTLEAAIHDCNCVVSHHCPVREYFDHKVWICDPASIDSIEREVLKAWAAPKSIALKDKILKEFTWKNAAHQTLGGYQEILSI